MVKKCSFMLLTVLCFTLFSSQDDSFIEETEFSDEVIPESPPSSPRLKIFSSPTKYSPKVTPVSKKRKITSPPRSPRVQKASKDGTNVNAIKEMIKSHDFDQANELIAEIKDLRLKKAMQKEFSKEHIESIEGQYELIESEFNNLVETKSKSLEDYENLLYRAQNLLEKEAKNKWQKKLQEKKIPKLIKSLEKKIDELKK